MRRLTLLLYVSLSLSGMMPGAELVTQSPSISAHGEVARARALLATGNYTNAERSLRQALASNVDADGLRMIRTVLADLLREEGRLKEARPIFEEVLRSTGVTPRQKFDALSGMADVDGMLAHPGAALEEWDSAIAAAREMKDPVLEATALRGLGMTWLDAGDPSRAEPLMRRALKMMDTAPEPAPAMTAAVLTCLGRCYRMENKLALAEDVLSRALEINRKAFGETHPQVAYVMERLGEIYALRNQFTLARDYSSRAIAVMKASCGENSAAVAAALANRANIEQHANDPGAAADNFAAALKIVQSTPEMRAQNVVLESQILERYALVLKATHRDREAKDISALAKSFRTQFK